jgi:hypothetical protein
VKLTLNVRKVKNEELWVRNQTSCMLCFFIGTLTDNQEVFLVGRHHHFVLLAHDAHER